MPMEVFHYARSRGAGTWARGLSSSHPECGYSTVTIAQAMIAPNQVRAQYTGMYLLISNVVGAVIGISLVAIVSEYVFGDRNMLGYSLALVCSIAFVIAAVILTFGMKPYARSMAEIGARTAEAKSRTGRTPARGWSAPMRTGWRPPGRMTGPSWAMWGTPCRWS